MSVSIREVKNRSDLKKFIYLPEKLNADRPKWLPPLYSDEWNYYNPEKNRAHEFSDSILYLAEIDNKPVGRIMGIINHRMNDQNGTSDARFTCLDAYEDQSVVNALLDRIHSWAASHGMHRLVGPLGFSDQDPEGFLIEGFQYPATITTNYNFPWMIEYLQDAGYHKEVDYVVYRIRIPDTMPDIYEKIHKRISRNREFQVVEFNSRKHLKAYVQPILSLMNECYAEIYGFMPMDQQEMEELAAKYLPILDPKYVKVVEHQQKLVAFVVGMPDISDGIRAARGRLFPFGILKIMWAARKTEQLDLLLGGIKEEFRGRGLDVLMGHAMLSSAMESGMKWIDTHHELEHNTKIRAEMERVGGEVYKRYRVFQKSI